MEIKAEVDSDAVTECSHDDSPAAGMLGFQCTMRSLEQISALLL